MWWSLFFAVSTWISLIALAGWIANDKGRDAGGFMLAALVFPLAGVVAACACREYPKNECSAHWMNAALTNRLFIGVALVLFGGALGLIAMELKLP